MHFRQVIALTLAAVLPAGAASAYESNVVTHSCTQMTKADDTLVVTKTIQIPSDWDPKHNLSIFSFHDPASGDFFQLDIVEHTVRMLRSLPPGRGMGSILSYESMDPVHDGVSSGGPRDYSVKFKVYISDDFAWIEASDAKSQITPIRNTVYFVGAPATVIANEIKVHCNQYNYTNSEQLKGDIQKNYSTIYYPNATPGMIEFSGIAKSLLSNLSRPIEYDDDPSATPDDKP